MNEFKGTPGPWDFSYHIQPNGCPTVGHKGLMVCMVAHSAKDPSQKEEEALANAALISAAPDLLKALIRLEAVARGVNGYLDSACTEAQDAIEKALGEYR